MPTGADAQGSTCTPPTVYFLERHDSIASHTGQPRADGGANDAAEIEIIPEGSAAGDFAPRPVVKIDRLDAGVKSPSGGGWLNFLGNVNKKTGPISVAGGIGTIAISRSAPVKVDPKVFFANERTFLAWLHVSVILAGASVAIVAFADSSSFHNQIYGVILLPVSIAFIIYAMMQYTRRASMIRRKAPGPYVDIVGPIVLTVILIMSIIAQFSIKLYSML